MLKKTLVFLILFSHFQLFAQNYSLAVKSGYSFPILKQMQGTGDANNLIYISYGKGWPIELEFSKRVWENIWINTDIAYFHGDKQVTDKLLGTTEYFSEQFRSTFSAKIIQKIGKHSLFTQVGAIVPLKTQFYRTLKREDKNYYATIIGYTTLGVDAVIGFNYSIQTNLSVSLETEFLAQRIRIKDLFLDASVVHYERNQTYELPFSSANSLIVIRYYW